MTLPNPLRPMYWLEMSPPPLMWIADRFLMVLALAIFVGSIALWVMARKPTIEKLVRRAMESFAFSTLWIGLTGIFLYVANDQRAVLLSMRLWWLLWFIWIGFTGYRAWKRFTIEIPEQTEKQKKQAESSKWLPKAQR